MKNRSVKLDYKNTFLYIFIFLSFIIFSSLEKTVKPYSVAIYSSFLAVGGNFIFTSILYVLSYVVLGEFTLVGEAGISVAFFIFITLIYKKFKNELKFEVAIFTLFSLIGYLLLSGKDNQTDFTSKVFVCLASSFITLISFISFKTLKHKGLKYKLGYEEVVSIALYFALFGLGICNLISPHLYKGIAVFTILLLAYFYKPETITVFSAVLGITYSIYYNDITFVSVFLLFGLSSYCIKPFSRHLEGALLIVTDYLVNVIFNIYSFDAILIFIPSFIASLMFSLIPTYVLDNVKNKLNAFRSKQLERESINRSRLMLSNRLYELSGVFTQMADTFNSLKGKTPSEKEMKELLINEIISSNCENCSEKIKCEKINVKLKEDLKKLSDIGFAKGKISLIDFPKNLSKCCNHSNELIYSYNKLLSKYRSDILENMNHQSGKTLLSEEALGVSNILKGLALETGSLLKYQSKTEKTLSENLFKKGFLVSEILIYGEKERTFISLILTMKEYSLPLLTQEISKTVGFNMRLFDKADITEEKTYLIFKKDCDYDAVFGLSFALKDNSKMSGDTHAVTRLKDDMFLVALSDGMGSGESANNVSSVSLSLIESFYKAGLNSELILSTVNKLLAINLEDSFTALDISVIDLKTCSCDFIKYGSPYGFIIGKSGIKIVEGSSLPMGILNELKPSCCHTELEDGDMLLFFTDGISDAFGSSSEIIEYLRSVPAKNPQTLADGIKLKALKLSNGEKKDDMTVLAVRIFKKIAV